MTETKNLFSSFSIENFRSITIQDLPLMRSYLENSLEESCEFSLSNLYCWKDFCKTKFQIWQDRLYIWFSLADLMIFTVNREKQNEPSAKELYEVAEAMKHAGYKGEFYQVRKNTLLQDRSFPEYFHIEPGKEDISEYIYAVKNLSLLPGQLLGKKRNLIHQFLREHPDVKTTLLTAENWHIARRLAQKWYDSYTGNKEDLAGEIASLNNMEECFSHTDLTGIMAMEKGECIAFATASPITKKIWTEPLEKALSQCKGAAQFINNELSKMLEKKNCLLLNREQDLGLPGLRQAKLSYLPEYILQNHILLPK